MGRVRPVPAPNVCPQQTLEGGLTMSTSTSRRSFLALSGVVAAGVASTTFLAACGPSTQTTSSGPSGSGPASSFGDSGTMRVGMEVAYPPFNWQTSTAAESTIPVQGQEGAYADGYDVFFAKRIGAALGLEPVAVKMEFSGLVEGLAKGSIDIICGGMTATDERRQSIDFSDAYWTGHYGLLVKRGSRLEGATGLDAFSGTAVLGQRDTLLDTVIDEIPNVNHMTPVDSVPAQLSSLNQGTCDAITYDVENEKGLIAANPDLVAVEVGGSKVLFKEDAPINAGIAKGHDETLAKINEVIRSVTQEQRQAEWDAVQGRLPE